MAAATFRAAGAKSEGGLGGLNIIAPAGVATGDLEILIATCDQAETISITNTGGSSWTNLVSALVSATAANNEKLYIWWRVRQSGDGNPELTNTADHICATRLAYTAGTFDATTPIEALATGTEDTADTSYSFAPGNSTAGSDRLVLSVSTTGRDSGLASTGMPAANANLTSLNSRADYCTSTNTGGGFGVTEGVLASAGAVGTWTSTYASSSRKAYASFAIRPFIAVYNDSGTGTVSLSGSKTETLVHSDGLSGVLGLTGSKVEALVFADSRSGAVPLAGSAVEGLVFGDSRSGTVPLAGSGVENVAFADALSGAVALSGSVSEAAIFQDALTGLVPITGSGIEDAAARATYGGTDRTATYGADDEATYGEFSGRTATYHGA